MNYTVKKLAALSGVSVRTLHYYDEIGLLKPAFIGENNYRYYQEDQLLRLQQILFFRELGFNLEQIKTILMQDDFDTLKALRIHAKELEQRIERLKKLSQTIDTTINHLEGKQTMKEKELFYGFDESKQKEYEQYIVKSHGSAQELLLESKKRTVAWGPKEWEAVKQQGDALHKALAKCIDQGLSPESDDVQALIHEHYQMIGHFYDASKEVYIGLSDLYAQHPDFRKFFDVYHPHMIEFIGKAMKYYADKHLA